MSPSGTCRHSFLRGTAVAGSNSALRLFTHMSIWMWNILRDFYQRNLIITQTRTAIALFLSNSLDLFFVLILFFLKLRKFSILIWTLFLKVVKKHMTAVRGKNWRLSTDERHVWHATTNIYHYSALHIFFDSVCLYRSSEAHALGTEQTIHRLERKITKAAN